MHLPVHARTRRALVALGACFVLLASSAAAAADRIALPNLQIVSATLVDGRLLVAYRNAGAATATNPFTIALQWLDAANEAVGAARMVTVTALDGDVVTFLDSERAVVRHRAGRMPFARPREELLADTIAHAPGTATQLRVTLDADGDVQDADGTDNEVVLPLPLPDLAVFDATVTDDGALTFAVMNRGDGRIGSPWAIAFQWVDDGDRAIGGARGASFDVLESGQTIALTAAQTVVTRAGVLPGARTASLAAYLAARPEDASRLRIVLDPDNGVAEGSEKNNVLTVAVPYVSAPALQTSALPDFRVADAVFAYDHVTFTARNEGDGGAAGDVRVTFAWRRADGAATGARVWAYMGFMSPQRTAAFDSETLLVSSEVRAGFWGRRTVHTAPLTAFLQHAPKDAAHLVVALDVDDSVLEVNEGNNAAVLPRALADVRISDAHMVDGALVLAVRNDGAGSAGAPLMLDFTWLDHAGVPLVGTARSIPLGVLTPGEERRVTSAGAGVFMTRDGGDPVSVMQPLSRFLADAPAEAGALRILVDRANAIPETDERANAVVLAWQPTKNGAPKNAEQGAESDAADTDEYAASDAAWEELMDAREAERQTEVRVRRERARPRAALREGVMDAGGGQATERTAQLVTGPLVAAAAVLLGVTPTSASAVLPDLRIAAGARDADGLTFDVVNDGGADATDVQASFQWRTRDGASIGAPRTATLGALAAGAHLVLGPETDVAATYTERFLLVFRRLRVQRLAAYVMQPPDGASALAVTLNPNRRIAESNDENNSAFFVLPGTSAERDDAAHAPTGAEIAAEELAARYAARQQARVARPPAPLRVLAAVEPASGPAPIAAQFHVAITGGEGPYDVQWKFSDGVTGGTEYVDRRFAGGGLVTATATVRDVSGAVVVSRATLVVAEPREAADLAVATFGGNDVGALAVVIENRGGEDSASFTVEVEWRNAYGAPVGVPYRRTHRGLAPGWRFQLDSDSADTEGLPRPFRTFVAQPPASAVTLALTVDPAGIIADSERSNNRATTTDWRVLAQRNFVPVASAETVAHRTDANGDGNEQVTLDGSRSRDADGVIQRWRWRIGRAFVGSGEQVTFRAPVGTTSVILEVVDDGGAVGRDTTIVTVRPPSASMPAPAPASEAPAPAPETSSYNRVAPSIIRVAADLIPRPAATFVRTAVAMFW
ncbi:MAG: hypothetical protein Q7T01_05025 [bacterium]|nr:hypothetical protein [bacterium]